MSKQISTELVKELRESTGISVMQCKKALEEADGDRQKALAILSKKSKEIATKKADRALKAGAVSAYIHGTGNVGVMLELSCETDFVSKNPDFKALAYDIAMHIAASNPQFAKKDEITAEARKTAEEIFAKEVEGKPEKLKAQILEGKINAYFAERILTEQPFIKNPDITIGGLIDNAVQKFGEKIEVSRFVRYSVS